MVVVKSVFQMFFFLFSFLVLAQPYQRQDEFSKSQCSTVFEGTKTHDQLMSLLKGGEKTAQYAFDRSQEIRHPLLEKIIREDTVSMSFLANHRVYLSLTTSPTRIKYIEQVLGHLDLTHIKKVFVSIPWKFGRDGREYKIPLFVHNHPKIQILRMEKDLGPISKMLVAAEYLKKNDPDSYLISLDDDTDYPSTLPNEMISNMARHPNSVLSPSIHAVSSWNISSNLWEFENEPHGGQVVEGWASIGYPVNLLDTQKLRKFSQLSRFTYLSDDLVISFVLALDRIHKRKIDSPYLHPWGIYQHGFGFEEDALHRGGGGHEGYEGDFNMIKYEKALLEMNQTK